MRTRARWSCCTRFAPVSRPFPGVGFWEDLAEHPDRAASFDALTGRQLTAEAPVVAAAYDWSALGDVVDVGGGDGSLLIALLRAHPTLRGTVLDLASPAATAARALAAAGLADRGRPQTGSFFEPLPPGAGGYIVSRMPAKPGWCPARSPAPGRVRSSSSCRTGRRKPVDDPRRQSTRIRRRSTRRPVSST